MLLITIYATELTATQQIGLFFNEISMSVKNEFHDLDKKAGEVLNNISQPHKTENSKQKKETVLEAKSESFTSKTKKGLESLKNNALSFWQ